MDLLQQIVARAKADKQRIVLPEAEEERTLKAADKVLADDLADITDSLRSELVAAGFLPKEQAKTAQPHAR